MKRGSRNVTKLTGQRGGQILHIDRTGCVISLWESDHLQPRSPAVSPDGCRLAVALSSVESNVAIIRRF